MAQVLIRGQLFSRFLLIFLTIVCGDFFVPAQKAAGNNQFRSGTVK